MKKYQTNRGKCSKIPIIEQLEVDGQIYIDEIRAAILEKPNNRIRGRLASMIFTIIRDW